MIAENKWRAARYGIQGKLIDFGKQEEVDFKILANELLEFIDDVVNDLRSREEVNYLKKILEMGSGADRQLEVWEQSHDTKSVVDYIIDETYRGLDI